MSNETTYKRVDNETVQFLVYDAGVLTENGTLVSKAGKWFKLNGVEVDLSGVTVQPKSAAEQAAEDAAKQAAQASAAKRQGVEILGVMVSLTEENQNGIASVMTGASLAAEVGAPFFPLNFNVMTAAGVETMVFDDLQSFKDFALSFMAHRQAFFQ